MRGLLGIVRIITSLQNESTAAITIRMPRLKAPQRREQLMDVATKLIARNGYEATTTAAIAQAAGITEPILYRHFKSKQDLFVAIVKAMSDRTMTHWRELIEGVDDPAEQIRRIAAELP